MHENNTVNKDYGSRIEAFFSRPQVFWGLTSLIGLLAVLSRFVNAEEKPFHHDESLHAYYSQRVAAGNPHVYDGMLHGPFLYYFVGAFMKLAGSTDLTAHLPASLFGVFVVMIPLLLRKHVGSLTTLVMMLFLLTSPVNMYFGRFLREDVFTSIWVMGTCFGLFLYFQTRKPIALYFSFAMLAFHFTNKENSYLHAFVWGLGIYAISLFNKTLASPQVPATKSESLTSPVGKLPLTINSAAVFITIFVLFYSAFFMHPNGWLNGVWDGIFEKSLRYWWEQNDKRRIDGPFDYHLPILANYEFVLIPFVVSAWVRIQRLSHSVGGFSLTSGTRGLKLIAASCALLIVTLFAPRLALVPEGCGISEYCLNTLAPEVSAGVAPVIKRLHIAHTRHLLQIICYVVFGSLAFFSAVHTKRKADAFLWFWLTAALGIYSYVGEKVPWLNVYITIPALLVASLEVSRIFTGRALPFEPHSSAESLYLTFKKRLQYFALVWLVVAIPFTVYKAVRASFVRPADPAERFVFTQTTPQAKAVRDRWRTAKLARPSQQFRVTVTGEATWPFAWYVQEFPGFDFSKPTAETANNFEVIIIDTAELEMAKNSYSNFNIYSMPLRAWWVPNPNPTVTQMLRYFFTGVPYVKPGTEDSANPETGFGDTRVLYLERANGIFEALEPPAQLTLLHAATGTEAPVPPVQPTPAGTPTP